MKSRNLFPYLFIVLLLLLLSGCTKQKETTEEYQTLMESVELVNLPEQENKDVAYRFSEGLSFYMKGGLWGYINKQGTVVIVPQYSFAAMFSDGLSIVEKDNLYGYIDRSGKEIIAIQYQDARNFVDGTASVFDGEKWFLIDKNGETLSDFDYSLTGQGNSINLNDGYATYREGELWGYVDQTGNLAIPAQFEQAGLMSNGYAFVIKENREMIIDQTGKNAFPDWEIRDSRLGFQDGLALITLEDGTSQGKSIVIDDKGNVVFKVPTEYGNRIRLSEGLVSYLDAKKNKWGCLDLEGNKVIPPVLDMIASSSDGVVEVYIGDKIPFYIKNPVWQQGG